MASFILNTMIKNQSSAFMQALVPTNKEMKQYTTLARKTILNNWKPIVAVTAGVALVAGARKVYSTIKEEQTQLNAAPNAAEVERLRCLAEGSTYGHQLDCSIFEELSSLADDLLNEMELEDCLETDESVAFENEHFDDKSEIAAIKTENEDEKEVHRRRARINQYRRNRKSINRNCISHALKAMTNKIRVNFPMPDGTPLQQKAMSLFISKECKKLFMRESDMAALIPKAVALASVPTTAQVDVRQLMKTEPVLLKYNKMAWSGFKNRNGWLSRVAAALPSLD